MTKDEVAKIVEGMPDGMDVDDYLVELVNRAIYLEREKVAKWMIAQGYATGHGDTTEDLLKELEWQIKEKNK